MSFFFLFSFISPSFEKFWIADVGYLVKIAEQEAIFPVLKVDLFLVHLQYPPVEWLRIWRNVSLHYVVFVVLVIWMKMQLFFFGRSLEAFGGLG